VLRLGIVGCGDVAHRYGRTLAPYADVPVVVVTDTDSERARAFVGEWGGDVVPTLDDLLADGRVDCVVNLTPFEFHAGVTGRALEAGKHVHTEKPLALDTAGARALVGLADRTGLRLSCAPITFMGHGQQAAYRAIQEGRAGEIRLVYAEVNHGRIETWHPRPEPFYAIGPLFDVGVYPLTILAAFFGPAHRVTAWGAKLLPSRVTMDGGSFEAEAFDCIVAVVELETGTVARLTVNFYVHDEEKRHQIQFHGDRGSVLLSTWQDFDADVGFAPYGGAPEWIPYDKPGDGGVDYGLALRELDAAIREDRPHAPSAERAAHVVEVMCAIRESAEQGRPVELQQPAQSLG
jgi:predicted dehydrogenase